MWLGGNQVVPCENSAFSDKVLDKRFKHSHAKGIVGIKPIHISQSVEHQSFCSWLIWQFWKLVICYVNTAYWLKQCPPDCLSQHTHMMDVGSSCLNQHHSSPPNLFQSSLEINWNRSSGRLDTEKMFWRESNSAFCISPFPQVMWKLRELFLTKVPNSQIMKATCCKCLVGCSVIILTLLAFLKKITFKGLCLALFHTAITWPWYMGSS